MEGSRSFARVAIGLIVVSSALSILAEPAVAQNPVPALSFQITPAERHADITASRPGTALFQGNYTVNKLSFERAVVTFQAVVSTGWAVSISPSSITISGAQAQTGRIDITVVVPPGELATNIGTLTVTGRAIAGGLQSPVAQATAIVVPDPYFRVVLAADNPFMETSYSTQVVVSMKIYNEGNVRDTVKVDIENLDELSEVGWYIVLTRQSFLIGPPPEFQPIQLTIGLPKNWQFIPDNKVQTVRIVAQSQEATLSGDSAIDVIPVFVRTVGISVPGFDVPLVMLGAVLAAMVMGSSRRKKRA